VCHEFIGCAREEQMRFSNWLLEVGEAHMPAATNFGDDVIALPRDMILHGDKVLDMVNEIYGHDPISFSNSDFLRGRAILTTTNRMVDNINDQVLERFPREVSFFLHLLNIYIFYDSYVFVMCIRTYFCVKLSFTCRKKPF
jgi:hypothetical protein